jgi:hypothetical protein
MKVPNRRTVAKNTLEALRIEQAGVKEKATPKKQSAKRTRAAKPAADASVTPPAPGTPDPRLPPPGTLLQKRDRHGAIRCECTVEAGGFRYAGQVYRSLSAAAMAAAKDLGLANKTQNGWTFWSITKPARSPSDPLAALERVWERYQGNVEALVKQGVTEENRSRVVTAISKHAQVIEGLRETMA